jgi:hypothetical protein
MITNMHVGQFPVCSPQSAEAREGTSYWRKWGPYLSEKCCLDFPESYLNAATSLAGGIQNCHGDPCLMKHQPNILGVIHEGALFCSDDANDQNLLQKGCLV